MMHPPMEEDPFDDNDYGIEEIKPSEWQKKLNLFFNQTF